MVDALRRSPNVTQQQICSGRFANCTYNPVARLTCWQVGAQQAAPLRTIMKLPNMIEKTRHDLPGPYEEHNDINIT